MSVSALQTDIKEALKEGQNAVQTVDNAADIDAINNATAEKIAKGVQKYLKASMQSVIGGGVAIPQDGGTGLKTTMIAKINSI